MCGISGYFCPIYSGHKYLSGLKSSLNSLFHRGPDDGGFTLFNKSPHHFIPNDSTATLPNIEEAGEQYIGGFGHRRLSIVDLSLAGHQPFSAEDLTITFNGEIYNYIELRDDLKQLGHQFKTDSDTEVLLKAYQHWGENCLSKLDGMFAFVIYDCKQQKAFGARDRIGVKPFYFIHKDSSFCFASEQHALQYYPNFNNTLNSGYLFDLFVFGEHERRRESIYTSIQELKAGECFIYSVKQDTLAVRSYYKLDQKMQDFSIDTLQSHLERSISRRMRTPVNIGACLSGGLDSSVLCGVMSNVSDREIQSFTAHYPGTNIDEGKFAKSVIDFNTLNGHFVNPSFEDLNQDFSEFIKSLDLPIWSTSTYSQWRVLKLAKEHNVKVVLDGQGADELFGGYVPHQIAYYRELLNSFKIITLLSEVSKSKQHGLKAIIKDYFKLFNLYRLPKKTIQSLLQKQRQDLAFVSPDFLDQNFEEAIERKSEITTSRLNSFLEKELINGRLKTFLRCEDRCSMWHNIESRTPFSDDIGLIEYAMSIPANEKIINGRKKAALLKAGKKYIPQDVFERKDKIGFATPHNSWTSKLAKNKKFKFDDSVTPFLNCEKLNNHYESYFSSSKELENVHNFKYLAFVEWTANQGINHI